MRACILVTRAGLVLARAASRGPDHRFLTPQYNLSSRKVSLPALAVQHVVNLRGPDALVGAIPGEKAHAARLGELCARLYERGEALVCELPVADVVLIPRVPSVAAEDTLYFVVYATNLRAVELCEQLRRDAKVAVVLDVDNTLIDASAVTLSQRDWALVDWVPCTVFTESGRRVAAQWARLGASGDPLTEDVYLMHWRIHGLDCTFHVRVRKGWSILRAFLARNADRFETFICSKGKQEYLELLWTFLDPEGILIAPADWPSRMTSTFPDALPAAAPKTALSALGCASVLRPHVATQLAAPIIALDDSRAAYLEDYEASIMYVEEYKPSETQSADSGSVLWQATRCLDAFWQATCTDDGAFAWQAAQSFAAALLNTVRRTRMESPDAIAYLQQRCRRQGEALWHQFTARSVFAGNNYIQDDPELLAEAIRLATLAAEGEEVEGEADQGASSAPASEADPMEQADQALERAMSARAPRPIHPPCYASPLTPPAGASDEEDPLLETSGSASPREERSVPAVLSGGCSPAETGSLPTPRAGLLRDDVGAARYYFAGSDAEDDVQALARRTSPTGPLEDGVEAGIFRGLSAA